ncbi:ATP-binding protein [Candidatus Pacearchaeota archaeon]|nr:ATP-binding protein [Candidatus Pacearchaeota archaeon]
MNREIVQNYIRKANPWWHEGKEFEMGVKYKERETYNEIMKFFSARQVIALTGLRRVGKTTIMVKIIKQALEKKTKKENIFYFSFDEFSEIRIMDLAEIYENIFGKIRKSDKYFMFFDEIQKVKNWSEQLKVVYDLYPNIKFVISGSESLFIRKKSRESLAGRIYEFKISPLSFAEFLEFKDVKVRNIFLQKEEIMSGFKQFLMINGFPEIVNSNAEEAKRYIKEGIIEKILYRDLVEVFDVKNPALIKSIFNVIYNEPGQIIEIQELSKELGVSRQTLSIYLEYLEESFLIKKLYNFSKNARKTERRLKRYYSSLINPLLIESNFSKVFEQFLVIQLDAEFFWRDVFKNEVDIVKTDILTAIEVKSGEIKMRDLESLKRFIEKFKPKKACVLSYDIEKEIEKIKIIPFYKYLLGKH